MSDRPVYGLDDFQLEKLTLTYSSDISAEIEFRQDKDGLYFWRRSMLRKKNIDWDYVSVKRFKHLRICVNDALRHLRLCTDDAVPRSMGSI